MADKKMIKAPRLNTLKPTAKEEPWNSDKVRTIDPRPTFCLSEEDLPEILKWTIDGKYTLTMEVEMRGIAERDHGHLKDKKVADFRITKVGVSKNE